MLKFFYSPLIWKVSKTIAIHKPGKDSSDPYCYHAINLLNTMSKILEKIIKEKLAGFVEETNILPPQQFGFRSEHNTIQPLFR